MHRLIIGKTKEGKVIKDWKNEDWDIICRQCNKVIQTFSHLFYEVVKEYSNKLSSNVGTARVFVMKSILGDLCLLHDNKKKSQILAQLSIYSLVISEICRCGLASDKLSWRRTCFQLIAYFTQLLGLNNAHNRPILKF